MISINGEKKRNLQEQVGFNTEQIEKIFEILDGLNVQDSVVIIPDMSYILSQEELEIINREVAFIVYDNQLYIKKSQDSSLAYFDIVFTIVKSSTVISFNSKEIQVTLSNGALGIVVSTSSTYNQTQIDTLLSTKASITYVDAQIALCAKLSGANFTGAITAPSIVENMSGYSVSKNTALNWTPIYIGACKNGNKITFVIFGTYTFATGDSVGRILELSIPENVGEKLYPYVVGGESNILCRESMSFSSSTTMTPALNNGASYDFQKGSNTKLYVNLRQLGNASLSNETTYYFRIEQTFLLSDNLAS